MTRTVPAPKTKAPVVSAADYFAAKLAYEMTPWTLKGLLDNGTKDYFILDVRTPEDFKSGCLPTAVNIPLADLTGKFATLPKNKTIVTYCANITCALAPKAALELAQKGFKVMELFGGVAEWTASGFPVEKKA